MSIYYQDDLVTLYHGDCLTEHLEWLDADVLVTDPPYGINWEGGPLRRAVLRERIEGDKETLARDDALELWGNAKPGICFGVWQKPRPAGTKARIIWAKNQMTAGNLNHPWGPADEGICLLEEWQKRVKGGKKRFGGTPNRWRGILEHPVVPYGHGHHRDHPTPKPLSLMNDLIKQAPPGSIADPFAGSGSTLVAAKLQGRRAIGVELEEKYCEIAAHRLSQEVLDLGSLA